MVAIWYDFYHWQRHKLLLNGALHWLDQSYDYPWVIIVFDERKRSLSKIP